MHKSVLLKEVLSAFETVQLKTFVDGTLGAGGHSLAILSEHLEIERLVGFDQDPEALSLAKVNLQPFEEKCRFVYANFTHILDQVKEAQGILVDLGVSSMQLDQAAKGFSFRFEGPLDMRMNPENPLTAQEIVNTWEERALFRIFKDYGEEKRAYKAAKALVQAREQSEITTTQELVQVLEPCLYDPRLKIHPLTRVFQALRIAVNSELEVLADFLPKALSVLSPGGRLAVISFHSLEDRIVKQFFRHAALDKEFTSGLGGLFLDKKPEGTLLTTKPIEAQEEEIRENPRSRSAKLRIIEKRV